MPVPAPITDSVVEDSIFRAVQNVCRTMMRQEVRFVEKSPLADYVGFRERPHIFGNVGFVGQANGVVYLCIPDDFASYAAEQILGMSAGEVQMNGYEIVKDVIGEVTNMTVGGFKNALCDIGFPCMLTLPTIVRGDNLEVATLKSAIRYTFHFECAGHRLIADIQLKHE